MGLEPPYQPRYSFGAFLLDPVEKVLLRNNHSVHLPPKAIETLLALVEKPGHVLEKAELLSRVWPDTFVEEATLAQNIFILRKTLGENADEKEYIETVPKRGYRFVAAVRVVEASALLRSAQETSPQAPRTSRRIWAVSITAGILLSAGIWISWQRLEQRAQPVASRTMLAVIPFENLSGDPAQDYFSDGLTEELITKFGSLSPQQLGVIARTTSMQFKGTRKNAEQIGRELGVDYIVEGSVVRGKERVRINAQLIRVADQTHLWAQSYERNLSGVLALQDDVAAAIADAIEFKLEKRVFASSPNQGTENAAAYDAYLEGRYFWNERSEQGHLNAIKYFQQAISQDPGYAQAYSGLADANALLGSNPSTAVTRQEAMEKARTAALKALSLDDSLAEAHTSLAFIYWHYDWNWPAAEREFQRALQLNPSYPTAHHWYAYFLMSQGRTDQSLEEMSRAQELDPLSLIINTDAAEMLYFAKRYGQAIQQANRVLEMDQDFTLAQEVLTRSFLAKHQYRAALAEAEKGTQVHGSGPYVLAYLAITYAEIGQRAKVQPLLRQLKAEAKGSQAGGLSLGIATIYAALGDKDEAFLWLQKDFQNRNGGLTLIKVLPTFDSLHSDPRFADLVRRIGLS
jgi:TolB-like protein/DNA-binding winged helix-turn-helix (wHTH) protein/Tfp pilus assembly protein PilF